MKVCPYCGHDRFQERQQRNSGRRALPPNLRCEQRTGGCGRWLRRSDLVPLQALAGDVQVAANQVRPVEARVVLSDPFTGKDLFVTDARSLQAGDTLTFTFPADGLHGLVSLS